jgi:tetratricopeptide (TPR) repeat protein
MAKRKQKRKKTSSPKPAHAHRAPSPPVASDPRQIEEFEAILARLREEHGLTSDAETADFVEDLIIKNGGDLPELPPRTPLEEAQGIFYRALEHKGQRRVELARKALAVSPDCADAYVLLAEETPDPKAARSLYEQGVVAAERAIGPERFVQEAGSFWGILEARPYIRALDGLADARWALGEKTESTAHLQEVLRVDPEDHLNVRYRLAARLLTIGDDDAVRRLMDRFPDDDSARWLYSRALMLFRRYGEGRRSWRALAAALEANPYVPAYLLGLEKLPRRMPDIIEAGERSEATEYIVDAIFAWEHTPGSVEWLAGLMDAALTQALDDDSPGLLPPPDPPNLLRPFWQ